MKAYTSIEICAGAGGQAIGLEQAGFEHLALVEIDAHACNTLRTNRPNWEVIEGDVRSFNAHSYRGLDLLAGGVPCPPFSIAGKQLGQHDERDLFPEVLRLTAECTPRAVMIENVKGILSAKFEAYRASIIEQFYSMGYGVFWRLLNASDYGVPQLRPRAILVALKHDISPFFQWPAPNEKPAPTVGEALYDEMRAEGWEKAEQWKENANKIAPTLVGGSKKHGGPDLGPTRAKKAWAELGVDGHLIANERPKNGFNGMPRLTVKMAAILQGFPTEWEIIGKKTHAYRQVGNAFPPPVAKAVGWSIKKALKMAETELPVQKETH